MDATREERLSIATTILRQMGGLGRLRAMVGAYDVMVLENGGVQFSFKGSRRYNKCRVILDFGMDLYTFELWHYNKRTFDCVKKYSETDLYFDMLKPEFERQTGLYLSL